MRYESIIGPKTFVQEKKENNNTENEPIEKKSDLYHNNLYRAKRKKNQPTKKQKIDKELIPYSGEEVIMKMNQSDLNVPCYVKVSNVLNSISKYDFEQLFSSYGKILRLSQNWDSEELSTFILKYENEKIGIL
jgi:RNA recognition motif-containing protein